ncbi:gliding motility-associated protein GldE [Flavihumibacter rivuli]|uniref:gliding motility-associated protein GldE n=1 Tax=Flavihumibacter rivuli TaxID=2838156 RepID=UPI001BDED7E2|nr:gliding motility-associated protein GldE [Flavihumibacter rivuli]ULQ55145.1 gliding motility-associated protein GldE [Flavihumibacter rivuli]
MLWTPLLLAANLQGTTFLVIVILVLLIISYFLSGAEVAFFSLSNKDINMLKTKQGASWKRIVNLLDEPKLLLGSMRIGNALVNITIIILSNFLIDQLLPIKANWWFVDFLIKVLLVTFFLVLFGEVLPKVYASQNNLRFARDASFLVEIVHLLFKRVSGWMVDMTDGIEKKLGADYTTSHFEELEEDSNASEEEKNILRGIAKFGNITVKQVMRTRLDVSGVDYNTRFVDLVKLLEEFHYSRVPVYRNSLDDVMGVLHTKDILPFLKEDDDFDWHTLMRQPYFVHEQKMIEDLLQDFRARRTHFAVVVDEFGGTSGIVTLEDIMEEIIGDIRDEFDEEDSVNKKLDDRNYIFEGRTMIHDVCRMMGLPVNTFDQVKGDSDSLAGLVLEIAGKIPAQDEMVEVGDFQFTVVELDRNRIQKVKVTIKS